MKRSIPLFDSPHESSIGPLRFASGVRSRVTRTNLEAGATPLVGRRAELDALRELVARERRVSVVGSPGIGKTRLARECAVRLLDDFMGAGGAWLIDVSRARTEGDIAGAIARAIGVEPRTTLGAEIATHGPMLIVLDDATDCAPAVVSLMDHVGRDAADVRWIVTSRVRLDAEREAILELGGMTLPLARLDPRAADSVQLFIERARAADIGWTIGDPDAIAAIAHALDGNPLAIEIAAAWLHTTSLENALARLAAVAPVAADDVPRSRHDGLRSAVAAAWELTSPDERRALTTLAPLVAGFDPGASVEILDVSQPRMVVEALSVHGLLSRRSDRRLEVARAVREQLGLWTAEPGANDVALDLPAGCVAVCARGTWFRTPEGPVVSISRWLALQNLLVRISEQRELAPNAPLNVEALVTAGWPGERIMQKAGATRVYTALSALRRLGLRRVLLRRSGGYLLDPAVPIVRVTPKGG
jgi:predicted ATPase